MAERSDDLQRSRAEAALLLRLDPQNLSPADELKCDLIATLRLSIDGAQADALEGRAADLGRLIVATEALVKLLPAEPPKPPADHADPRQQMWLVYKQMRERGELNLKPEAGLHLRIAELEGEVAALKAQLAGRLPSALEGYSTGHAGSAAITPREADITPPGEIGVCHAGPLAGPDDPKSPVTIEGRAVKGEPGSPLTKSGAAPPSRTQNWDSTPNAAAWRAWHAAGGAHRDRWGNFNE